MDPVVIGRDVFSVTNDTVSGIVGYIQDVLCAILDKILDITKGTCFIFNNCIACGAIFTLNIIMSVFLNPYLLPKLTTKSTLLLSNFQLVFVMCV